MAELRRMQVEDLDPVALLETSAYEFPWSRTDLPRLPACGLRVLRARARWRNHRLRRAVGRCQRGACPQCLRGTGRTGQRTRSAHRACDCSTSRAGIAAERVLPRGPAVESARDLALRVDRIQRIRHGARTTTRRSKAARTRWSWRWNCSATQRARPGLHAAPRRPNCSRRPSSVALKSARRARLLIDHGGRCIGDEGRGAKLRIALGDLALRFA